MAVGNWGTGLVFSVSDRRVLTPSNLTRKVSGNWATHSRVGGKDITEFIKPDLQEITFDLVLDAELGVRPRSMLEYIENSVETGRVERLVIGGRQLGRNPWRITASSEAWQTTLNGGELVRAKVTVTMKEYCRG